jgi:hypothetical protein
MIVMYLKMMPECLAHLNFYSFGMHTDTACLVSAGFFSLRGSVIVLQNASTHPPYQ